MKLEKFLFREKIAQLSEHNCIVNNQTKNKTERLTGCLEERRDRRISKGSGNGFLNFEQYWMSSNRARSLFE
ncbi:uncharacterized protein MONOS_5586 [Monocercomonoides exilis]|uniref:uncharacterized protein n=1 Tax=Monocercomonoides exilis TaxID=2049356 RepID=UPI00355A17CB|nr:hypothetical protein MONOS_5586 [Monocercomonoides exilis]|eukprot:MONOS_5586.1-p1 / transcript=MONOS_5586.1 / gene=MONOS_5586 / organism=Monocercomonoides_exilis_PA203 / gene_product=unspecified product / transcript_product=unspecified product / location=Mono_scaffold00164:78682-79505(+) / protein_length=72 / sequence_SO=supercontig / SO=protein_coding / is_pseudo=false